MEHRTLRELATAEDVWSGMERVVAMIRADAGAARVEWWAPGDDGELELVVARGEGHGSTELVPLGSAGLFVVLGGHPNPRRVSILAPLGSIWRRRRAEEKLEQTAMQLARRNEALEDYAALVAHELKTPLQAALLAPEPAAFLDEALDLVEALLEAAQNEGGTSSLAPVGPCVAAAARDLHTPGVEITTTVDVSLPLPVASLHVILRNLLANAVAAGAHHIQVGGAQSAGSWTLQIDDDGVGLADTDGYVAGSGLGFSLCRRIAARFGGELELAPRPSGGTRATLVFEGVPS